jgi:predicted RNase H-like HicB family nuclease
MRLDRTIKAIIRRGERQYVAECVEIAVVTQGETLDETMANLQDAVALHLEGEDLASFGLAPNPSLLVTMELGAPG